MRVKRRPSRAAYRIHGDTLRSRVRLGAPVSNYQAACFLIGVTFAPLQSASS